MVDHFIGDGIEYITRAADKCLEMVFSDFEYEVVALNIIQVSDLELLKVNQEFLKHDYLTDIITFNYSEVEHKVDGELYISYERVKENSDSSELDELRRVIIHGCLHLCGLNDATEAEKVRMREAENLYLKKCSTWN